MKGLFIMEFSHFKFKPWTPRNIQFLEASYVKRRSLILAFLCIFTAIMGAILMLIPTANLSGVSIGNGLEILIDSTKYILGKTEALPESSLYLRGFFLPLLAFSIFFVIIPLGNGILTLLTQPSERTAGMNAWICIFGKALIAIAYLIYVAQLSTYYALSSFVLYLFPLCAIPEIAVSILDFLYVKKHPATTEEEKPVIRMKRIFKKEWVFDAMYSFLIPLLLLASLFFPTKYNPLLDYSTISSAKIGASAMAETVGKWANRSTIHLDKNKDISIVVSPDGPLSWSETGNNFLYYQSKGKELKEAREALFPEDNTQEAWEKYAQTMEKMQQDINTLASMLHSLPLSTTNVYMEKTTVDSYAFARIKSVIHNADSSYADAEGKKWGIGKCARSNGLFVKESASLQLIESEPTVTQSSNWAGTTTTTASATFKDNLPFTTETDFSTALIRATVVYGDGSFKISFIKVKNADELNKASAGQHVLLWDDEWGEYSAPIYIANPN